MTKRRCQEKSERFFTLPSILFENVTIGRHSRLRRTIIDKNVLIPDGTSIGYDLEADRSKGYTVTESGIVVVPRKDK